MAVTPLADSDPREVGGYRLSGRLGAGGMGVVFLGAAADGSPVAVKVMRPELGGDAEFQIRFRREAEAARRVSGQFTAQVLAADPDADQPWLVTAYVAGPSLAEAVASYGPLPARSLLWLLAGVAQALGAIHAAGLVHRDLKPSNVLLADDGPRVIDFGIVRTVGATSVTATGNIAGSLQYIAPEQARGDKVGPAADVWGLGALGSFAATGRPPFGGGNDAALMYRVLHNPPNLTGCPPEVAGIIMACLNRDPAARPPAGHIAEWCTTSLTGGHPRAWLPSAIAADVTRHTVPFITSLPAAAPVPAAQPVPAAGQASTPAGPAAPPPGRPATAPLGPAGPPAGPAARPRRPSTGLIAGGVAVAVALILAVVVIVMSSNGSSSNDAGPQPTPRVPSGRAHTRPAPTRPALTKPAPTRKQPGIDRCVVGHWNSAGATVTNTVASKPVQFTGTDAVGWTLDVQRNGHARETWKNYTLVAAPDSNFYQEVVNGSATFTLRTRNSQLTFSNVSVTGTDKLLKNGQKQRSGPIMVPKKPADYLCGSGEVFQYSVGQDSYTFDPPGT